jgi:hypothetical protein
VHQQAAVSHVQDGQLAHLGATPSRERSKRTRASSLATNTIGYAQQRFGTGLRFHDPRETPVCADQMTAKTIADGDRSQAPLTRFFFERFSKLFACALFTLALARRAHNNHSFGGILTPAARTLTWFV